MRVGLNPQTLADSLTLRYRGLANASLIQNLITNYELRITNYLITYSHTISQTELTRAHNRDASIPAIMPLEW
jgi:hypothetical protein